MAYLMGIDLGTSSLKTVIIDETGHVMALKSADYQFDSPHPGYAEQDPEVWWKACCQTVNAAISAGGVSAAEISGVSFSGQMHGLVALDKTLRPVRPAILHCDARSDQQVEQLRERFGEEAVRSLMMNPVYTGFLLPSLLWIRENEPRNFEKIHRVCLPKDYLKLKLSGELSSDFSDASATLAFDIINCRWSEEILMKNDLPKAFFPSCYPTTANTGTVCQAAAAATGLSEKTAVIAGGADQVMQGIGNGMVETSDATVNIGSSGQVCFQIDRPVLNPALNTNMFCGYQPGRWILYGATMSAGLSLKWWNSILSETDYQDINARVSAIRPGSGGVIFLPYLNGERTPHLNPNLSGVFFGVNAATTRSHLTRAVMEGVAFSLMQCIEICGELGFTAKTLVASGGGARSRPWLQLQADIYHAPLKTAVNEEQASLGAAITAGVGAGVFADMKEACRAVVRYQDEIIEPNPKNHAVYDTYYRLYKDIFAACGGVLERLTVVGRKEGSETDFFQSVTEAG